MRQNKNLKPHKNQLSHISKTGIPKNHLHWKLHLKFMPFNNCCSTSNYLCRNQLRAFLSPSFVKCIEKKHTWNTSVTALCIQIKPPNSPSTGPHLPLFTSRTHTMGFLSMLNCENSSKIQVMKNLLGGTVHTFIALTKYGQSRPKKKKRQIRKEFKLTKHSAKICLRDPALNSTLK